MNYIFNSQGNYKKYPNVIINYLNLLEMPLEAAVVVLDNSEFSRNGDLEPSRWNA